MRTFFKISLVSFSNPFSLFRQRRLPGTEMLFHRLNVKRAIANPGYPSLLDGIQPCRHELSLFRPRGRLATHLFGNVGGPQSRRCGISEAQVSILTCRQK
jgi:hypothetical protein